MEVKTLERKCRLILYDQVVTPFVCSKSAKSVTEPVFVDLLRSPEPVFLNVYGAQESIPRMNSASLCSLAGRYDNPNPPRFLARIDCLKIPAQASQPGGIDSSESIPWLQKRLHIRALSFTVR
jgi:hypothetical protein